MTRTDTTGAGTGAKQSGQPAASVRIESVTKKYGGTVAVDGVSLDIAAGEFVSLLGPSGSGKTTLLMAIAGFERPDGGRILVGGRDVTGLPPHRRGFGVVFQRYALFPHMSVRDNVGYALRMRGRPLGERNRAVDEVLELVDLGGFADRRPDQLSGGQAQRVALARALVYRPPVILFDEPLGALDRKLREQVQLEIRRLHRELGLTMIFVTHDQEEALVLSDRVAVLSDGRIEQFDRGAELYHRPRTEFVAGFLGRTNSFDATVAGRDGDTVTVAVGGRTVTGHAPDPGPLAEGGACVVTIRPEALRLVPAGTDGGLTGTVAELVFSGPTTTARIDVDGRPLLVQGLSGDPGFDVREGDRVAVAVPPGAARVFPGRR
ncbi:ABC transporter ATP-binding protein [Actinomadura vinacea]|uniref:ABC transporter ATP-binding protein n=1 Tax=Actinomadura vinacea TaxID=115336 RepID=A0ABN3K161_9ACTN